MTAISTSTTNAINSGNQQHSHYNSNHSGTMTGAASIRFEPSLIEYKNLRFLITDKPTDALLNQYIEELKRENVTDVVRVCESTYSSERLEQAGIKCHDWVFDDGTPPSPKIIEKWLNLIIERFKDCPEVTNTSPMNRKGSSVQQQSNGSNKNMNEQLPCIAVHCVAGLGRAPVLVAIALIESGLKYEDAVERIRARRRGAINRKQLDYLSEYKPKKVLMFNKRKICCII